MAKRRIQIKLTQSEIALQTMRTLDEYQKIESGERLPAVDELLEISKVLRTSVASLLGLQDKEYDACSDLELEMRYGNASKCATARRMLINLIAKHLKTQTQPCEDLKTCQKMLEDLNVAGLDQAKQALLKIHAQTMYRKAG